MPDELELTPTEEVHELAPTVSPGKKQTVLDRIRAFYRASENEPVLLTDHDQRVLTRLEAAWGLLLDAKTGEYAVTKLMRRFELSRAQAYRALTDCKHLFGDVVESNRKADRYLMREMALTNYRKAKKAGDLQAMNGALALLVKITGIEKADPNIPDEAAFQPSQYLLEAPVLGLGEGGTQRLDLEKIAQLPRAQYEQVMDFIQHSGTTDLEMMRYIQEAARGTAD